MRSHIESALNDQADAQQLLRKNLKDQLAQLTVKEDNLLDLTADGPLPQDRIRQRLLDLARDRQCVTEQLSRVHGDLSSGRAFLDAHLNLLDNPYELYVNASEATRRKLNQAIFAHVYVAHDEVIGDDIRSQLRELLAAERHWDALTEGATPEVAAQYDPSRTVHHSGPETPKAAPKGGLAELPNLWLDLPNDIYEDADCSKPLMVEIRGLEPLTPCMPCKCATSCAISPYSFVCRRGDSSSVPRCLNGVQIGGPYFSKFFYFFLPPILICRKPDAAHRLRCAASGGKGFKANPGRGTSRPRAGSSNLLQE